MGTYYKKISVKERLPKYDTYVPTIDSNGEIIIYKLNEILISETGLSKHFWTMRDISGNDTPNDNLPILYWLEEVTSDDYNRCEYLKTVDEYLL